MSFKDLFRAILGICDTQQLDNELWSFEGDRVRLNPGNISELASPGGAVFLKGNGLHKPILVVRTGEDEYRAYVNKCTHAGRKIDPVPGEPVLRCCSVNHSLFDFEGRPIKGPGKKPLHLCPVERSDGDLIIKL